MAKDIYDKEDMKSILKGFPNQIRDAHNIETNISIKGKPDNIIICGMGGSSISGQLIAAYLESLQVRIPVFNVQNYHIPLYANKNSLIFINSYSGNTEESISCYREAIKESFNCVIITTNGKLKEHAENNHNPLILIPKGLQPRNAVAYLFFPILKVLENSGIIPNQDSKVKDLISALTRNESQYDSAARELADKLLGRLPIIYGSDKLFSVAYRWKCEFNENTKIPAYCHKFPELNHNELNGYINYSKLNIPMHIIMLKDEEDQKRILKRMDITKKLVKEIAKEGISFSDILVKGNNFLTRIFTAIYLGDLTSYYLAIKYATDPTPVDIIEKFKKEMGPFI